MTLKSNLLPIDKSDVEKINILATKGLSFYKPFLGDLFPWIKDINWPVARAVIPLLISAGADVAPYVREILESDDSVWKYVTLEYVVSKMPDSIILAIQPQLEKIVREPSSDDNAEGVVDLATTLLAKIS